MDEVKISEIAKPRLIDANSLLERYSNKTIVSGKDFLDLIVSAPTVETTDDVFDNLPWNILPEIRKNPDGTYVWIMKRLDGSYVSYPANTLLSSALCIELAFHLESEEDERIRESGFEYDRDIF